MRVVSYVLTSCVTMREEAGKAGVHVGSGTRAHEGGWRGRRDGEDFVFAGRETGDLPGRRRTFTVLYVIASLTRNFTPSHSPMVPRVPRPSRARRGGTARTGNLKRPVPISRIIIRPSLKTLLGVTVSEAFIFHAGVTNGLVIFQSFLLALGVTNTDGARAWSPPERNEA